ncbi:hypothetical protein D3C80_1746710 [compost metagenome]
MALTRTPEEPSPPMGVVWKTTWRALKAWPSGPATASTLARLLATTLRRCDWALMALPETLKMENMDMV